MTVRQEQRKWTKQDLLSSRQYSRRQAADIRYLSGNKLLSKEGKSIVTHGNKAGRNKSTKHAYRDALKRLGLLTEETVKSSLTDTDADGATGTVPGTNPFASVHLHCTVCSVKAQGSRTIYRNSFDNSKTFEAGSWGVQKEKEKGIV